jgi:DNA-binding winged helix-turn-helix (wHTH) protein/TolB-like protein/Flp pilus assembly protein TadD
MSADDKNEISFDEFTIDPKRRRLLLGDRTVSINPRAFDLLYFLAENRGRIVSKNEILDSVWKDQFVEEANLTVQISAIRRALGDKIDEPRFLITIPGRGYQFVGVSGSSERASADEDISGVPRKRPAEVERPKGYRRWQKGALLFTILSMVFGGVFAVNYLWSPGDDSLKSVAVLPFTTDASGLEAEYLGDGLAESVIFALSRLGALRVVSRDSAFRFRESPINAKEVGRELGVDSILTGRVRRTADTVSVSTELISVRDNSVIWGEQFDRRTSDVSSVQVDIARAISRELKLKLSDDLVTPDPKPTDADAYKQYLIGRYYLHLSTDDGFFKGRDAFRQAIEKDSEYALAFAGLADAYNMLCGWGSMAPNEGYPLAKAAALRALELDETLSEAHTSLGVAKMFYDADWTGAEKELKRALELNPSNADAQLMYGYELMLLGRFDEARPYMERARELDPLSIVKIVSIGNISYFQRDFETARQVYNEALRMDQNSGLAHWSVGNALLASGRHEEAIRAFEKAISLSGESPDEPASLGLAFALAGNDSGARRIIESLTERSSRVYVPPTLAATIHGALGDRDRAFELMEEAFRHRDSLLVYLKVDPIFDSLRNDPRFPALLSRMGLG